jgi:hypothetical protein
MSQEQAATAVNGAILPAVSLPAIFSHLTNGRYRNPQRARLALAQVSWKTTSSPLPDGALSGLSVFVQPYRYM